MRVTRCDNFLRRRRRGIPARPAAVRDETDRRGRLAAGPSHAYAQTKKLLNQSLHSNLEEQLKAEQEAFAACSTTNDFAEGIAAFVEKRSPSFQGH